MKKTHAYKYQVYINENQIIKTYHRRESAEGYLRKISINIEGARRHGDVTGYVCLTTGGKYVTFFIKKIKEEKEQKK